MTLRQTSLSEIPLSNFKDPSEIQDYDYDPRDNSINLNEAARAYASKMGKEPDSINDIYEAFGGARHKLDVVPSPQTPWDALGSTYSKGPFSAPGFGDGFCLTRHDQCNGRPTLVFAFRCDTVPMDLMNKIQTATLVAGPKGFPDGEAVTAPLDVLTEPSRYVGWSCGSGGYTTPETKAILLGVDRADLKQLAGDSGGVSFYAKLTIAGWDKPVELKLNLGDRTGDFFLSAEDEFKGLGER